MSSRARNFRRRGDDDDDDINENTPPPTIPSSSSSSSSSKPKKPQNQTPKNLLSFADDEDLEQQQQQTKTRKSIKPSSTPSRLSKLSSSSSSHKITSTKDRQTPSSSSSSSSTPSNVLPQAGTYTKEALLELQKNTRILAKPSTEPKLVLKGPLKPSTVPQQQEEEQTPEEDGARKDAETRLASMGVGFPDQAMIDAIRAKRERMRQSRPAAPDYISLDGGAGEGLSDEEPEFRERIAMFGTAATVKKKGVFEEDQEENMDNGFRKNASVAHVVDYGGVDNEVDEEEKIWEEEQFRKGLGKRMDDGTTSRVVAGNAAAIVSASMNVQQQNYMYAGPAVAAASVYGSMPSVPAAPTSVGGAFGASQGLDVMSISQQADVAKKAMQDNLMRLKESHGKTISLLTKTDENLSTSLLNITALEKSLSAADEKFIFMQKLRDFVSVICEFLQHKAPFIEELEEQMQKLHEQRASAILERRAADNDDEMMEVEAAVKAAMSVFSERGSSSAMIAVATSAAQAASAAIREQTNLPVKLDEFGRDTNLQRRMDVTRRAEARQQRKTRFDSKRLSSMEIDSSYQQIEGESSTDESDSESTAYQSNRDLLLQTADQIFSDASEEYSQLSVVKERFERWKRDYSSSYRDAYMSLSAPAIFSPYVRLELLKWDPLHEDADFFDMKWHSLLFNYGLPEDGSDISLDDADANLIPGLVERVALPILHHEIALCWDLFSTRETKNAVSATILVTNYVDPSSEALAELLVAIRTRLSDAVANIMVPTWSPLVLKAVPNAPRVAAYRFGMSVRLMRNICLWKEILALPVLEKLVVDELLCGKVLPHVRSIASNVHDAVTRTERIVASLSGVWSGPSITGRHSRKLQPLVDYVMSLGKIIEKKHGVDECETGGLARRLKKMLVELNEYDNARDIARTFRLKEAL